LKPTLQNISDPEQALKWTIFHVVLGVVSSFTPWGFIIFFYAVLYFNFAAAMKALGKGGIVLFTLLLAYLQGFEQIAKISKTFPFVPSEYAKYISVIFTVYALIKSKRPSNGLGITLLVLILPAIFYDQSGERGWSEIVNHFLSPLAVALGVMLWGGYRPPETLMPRMMRVLWFGLLTVLVTVFVRTPDYDSLDFELEANRTTAGGGSTNQVSTALGFGMFLTFYAIYKRQNFSGYRIVDMGIMGLFALQTLLTFSRGGMLGAIVAMAALVGASMLTKQKNGDAKVNRKTNMAVIYLGAGVIILYLVFNAVDNLTGGKLTQRYQGETAGTAGGYAEKDINRITSGRAGIFEEDVVVWKEYPVFGSGIGASPYLRMRNQASDPFFITPHIEISRLLAEHGIFGLIYFILIMYLGWQLWVRRNKISNSDVLIALYVLAFVSSFHSAMRTFVTPFLLTVCAIGLSKQEPKRA
jgi:hypothetical protein